MKTTDSVTQSQKVTTKQKKAKERMKEIKECVFCGYSKPMLPGMCMACIYKRWWLYPLRIVNYIKGIYDTK